MTEQKKKAVALFAEGRKNYKLMNFEQARSLFAKALEADPTDGPSKIYHDRCAEFVENPPPEDWDGVYVMKTK